VRSFSVFGRAAFLAVLVGPVTGAAQSAPQPTCVDTPVYRLLDFWLGEWDVFVGDEQVGHNRISKVLDGCAITEDWHGAGGTHGMSLFYVDPDGAWQQVWVTGRATLPGGTKEKRLVGRPDDRSVRFQGRIRHPEAGEWLDRTTLTGLADGSVRQVIEISRDNGRTWAVNFDAIYRRVD
jgi:hypothetical protein